MKNHPSVEDIEKTHKRIKKYVHKTPLLTSSSLNKMFDCSIYFKCENFQKTGSFKFRGALNSILALSAQKQLQKVCTHSSGNHAAALSYAASMFNITPYIVMFSTAPKQKINTVRNYGGQITFCEPKLSARAVTLKNIKEKICAIEIHSSSFFYTICGQGTVAKEIFEETNLDVIITPIGGGGLLSGTAIVTKNLSPKTMVIGAEPHNANDAYQSFKAGKLILVDTPKTICDGLLTCLSSYTFSIIKKNVDNIITAKEETIKQAMKLIWERLKIVVEPSACVPLAILIENPILFKGKKVGIILSGGNLDFQKMFKI